MQPSQRQALECLLGLDLARHLCCSGCVLHEGQDAHHVPYLAAKQS